VFPTTIWTRIREAGAQDEAALDEFARSYTQPVRDHIRARGFRGDDADDLCQEVFLRVFQGGVLEKADRARGRFRGLLRTVTLHTIQDRLRKRRPAPELAVEPADETDDGFDQRWAWHLTERALARLNAQGSPYHGVLAGHLNGEPQDRNKLWIARKKLTECIRREVAETCTSQDDFEAEIAYLAPFLRPTDNS
jgi:FAD/FMN-containing dehydrogenase